MSRGAALSLYALLVLIWSSTWVAIKIGLEDAPALLGAGVRFALAGVLLLGFAAARRRPLKTDRLLALILGAAAVRVLLRPRLLGRAVHPVRADRGAVRGDAALHGDPRRRSCSTTSRSARACCSAWRSRSPGSRWRSPRASKLGSEERARARRDRGGAQPARRRARQRRAQAARHAPRRDRAQRLGDADRRRAAARAVGASPRTGATRCGARRRSARSPTWRSSARRWRS